MIYLDYSATTPVSFEVLDTFNRTTKEFIGNPNSLHKLGIKSQELITSATKQIADICNIMPREVIYTSNATEANALNQFSFYATPEHRIKADDNTDPCAWWLRSPGEGGFCYVEGDGTAAVDYNSIVHYIAPFGCI